MLENILFVSMLILTATTLVVWPVMFMAHILSTERKNFGWSLLSIFASAICWTVLIIVLALLAKAFFSIDASDIENLKQLQADPARMLPLNILGGILYVAFDAFIFRLVLGTTFLKGIGVAIGAHVVRVLLFTILILIAVLLT